MAKLNTNSNVYTIVYAAIIVIIAAFLLAFVASALKPTQDANVENDRKSQVLASLNLRDQADIEGKYNEVIKEVVYISETDSCFKAEVDGQQKTVIPVKGAGLWGGLWGYVAVDADGETVFGTYFSHESETAGLGARIAEQWFQDSFKGKKLFKDGEVALGVYKQGKAPNGLEPDYYVDAVTGATLTSNGVDQMLKTSIAKYVEILKGDAQTGATQKHDGVNVEVEEYEKIETINPPVEPKVEEMED